MKNFSINVQITKSVSNIPLKLILTAMKGLSDFFSYVIKYKCSTSNPFFFNHSLLNGQQHFLGIFTLTSNKAW